MILLDLEMNSKKIPTQNMCFFLTKFYFEKNMLFFLAKFRKLQWKIEKTYFHDGAGYFSSPIKVYTVGPDTFDDLNEFTRWGRTLSMT